MKAIEIGRGTVSFAGNTGSPCPFCGGVYEILDGVYSFVDETVTLLSGPGTTIDALRRAAVVVMDSQAAGEAPEKTVERVAEILPSFKRFKGQAIAATAGLAIQTLIYLAGKFADPYVEPLVNRFRGETDAPSGEMFAMVKKAVREVLYEQGDLLERAPLPAPSPPKPPACTTPVPRELSPSSPQFPKSLEKMQREMRKRHADERLQRMTKRPDRKVPKQSKSSDGEQEGDQ